MTIYEKKSGPEIYLLLKYAIPRILAKMIYKKPAFQ